MKKLVVLILAAALLLSACAVKQAEETTTASSFLHQNEKGPFDEDHYTIGWSALWALDQYIEGKQPYTSVLTVQLKDCLTKLDNLPELPAGGPCIAGNDFVRSYVFLAYTDCQFHLSNFESKIVEDRNLLAVALGASEKGSAGSR